MKRITLRSNLLLTPVAALLAVTFVSASAEEHVILRDTSEVRVTVRDPLGMPVRDARVSMHILRRGSDQGLMEVKTDDAGKVEQDIIPVGDTVRLQVVASGYQPFGTDYLVNGFVRDVVVRLKEQPVIKTASVEQTNANVMPTATVSAYKEAQWVSKTSHTTKKARKVDPKTLLSSIETH